MNECKPLPPSWCSAGGCTSTGMGAITGFAAAPYSKMLACAAHAFSVAAAYGPPHVTSRVTGCCRLTQETRDALADIGRPCHMM